MDGCGGAVTGAVAAVHSVCIHHTEFIIHRGDSYMNGGFFFRSNGQYGSGRAYLRAFRTLGPTVTFFEAHIRHHQMFEVARRPENLVGAGGNAKSASGAMLVNVFEADCTERNNSLCTLRLFFIYQQSQASINFFLLSFYGDCPRKQCC
jgi:hypothetical protein